MHTVKSVERRGCSCCLLIVLAVLATIGLAVFFGVRISHAETPTSDTVLAIDHSPSNFECDGVGTDPELLRVQAGAFFINYLGAESGQAQHRLGVLHFGGQVQPVAPLTDLADVNARRRLLDAIERVQPIPWTDPALALDAADALLAAGGRPGRQTVVLFSDGDPAPEPTALPAHQTYQAVLSRAVARLADQRVTLIVVLLAGRNTSCAERVTADWLSKWNAWAASTPGGTLYTATTADDLLPIYHAIARDLTGAQGGEALARTAPLPNGAPLVISAPVTQSLASMTLTVWKSAPEIVVDVLDPQGQLVTVGPRVARSGEPGHDREEVWRISEPQPGLWQIALSGAGRVSVWQDTLALPPLPTASRRPSRPVDRRPHGQGPLLPQRPPLRQARHRRSGRPRRRRAPQPPSRPLRSPRLPLAGRMRGSEPTVKGVAARARCQVWCSGRQPLQRRSVAALSCAAGGPLPWPASSSPSTARPTRSGPHRSTWQVAGRS